MLRSGCVQAGRAWMALGGRRAGARAMCAAVEGEVLPKKNEGNGSDSGASSALNAKDLALLGKYGLANPLVVETIEESVRQAQGSLEDSGLRGKDLDVDCMSVTYDPNVGIGSDRLNPNFRLSFRAKNESTTPRLRYRSCITSLGLKFECSLRSGTHVLFGSGKAVYTKVPPVIEVGTGAELALGFAVFSIFKVPDWPGRYMVSVNNPIGVAVGASRIEGGVLYLDHNQERPTEQLRERMGVNDFFNEDKTFICFVVVFGLFLRLWTKANTKVDSAASNSIPGLGDDDDGGCDDEDGDSYYYDDDDYDGANYRQS